MFFVRWNISSFPEIKTQKPDLREASLVFELLLNLKCNHACQITLRQMIGPQMLPASNTPGSSVLG